MFRAGVVTGNTAGSLPISSTSPASTPSAVKIDSIAYTILAASVQEKLQTNTFDLTIDAGATMTITLNKTLPSLDGLVALFNEGVLNAFPTHPQPLPEMVQRLGGYVIQNTSTETSVFQFSENASIMWFSEQIPNGELTILPGTETAIFLPSPRLGAQYQQFDVASGGASRIKLPITGDFMTPVIYYPPSGSTIGLAGFSHTARVLVNYTAIDATVEEVGLTRTTVTLSIQE